MKKSQKEPEGKAQKQESLKIEYLYHDRHVIIIHGRCGLLKLSLEEREKEKAFHECILQKPLGIADCMCALFRIIHGWRARLNWIGSQKLA